MRLVQLIGFAITILAQLHCAVTAASLPHPLACESLPRAGAKPGWDPQALAGEYRVTWVSEAGPAPAQWRDRLWLWPTSMRDSSIVEHQAPIAGDTATHPLYGMTQPDTGRFDASHVRALRQAIDPIYPPVLLLTSANGFAWLPDNPWAVLLLGTAGNRRDGIRVTDGVGMAMRILESNAQGFRGNFGRWGIALTDRGHFCAERIRL
jgi:hypothetical protein